VLSVIIPSFARPVLLRKALDSLRANSRHLGEIIVLSPPLDDSYGVICAEFDARLIDDMSRQDGKRVKGLWQVLNTGIEISTHPYVCWLNDDCTVLPGWDAAALSLFSRPKCGIVSLRTHHAGDATGFIIIHTLHEVVCANYGVIRKADGLRFDERFSWFHGDADIALQAEFLRGKTVYGTDEPCVIHEHYQDSVRAKNESDPRIREDWVYLNDKWKGYSRIGSLKLSGIPARIVNGIRSAISLSHRVREKMHAEEPALPS
jgi:glycosyltransferase involved in cell wall biosynthesis